MNDGGPAFPIVTNFESSGKIFTEGGLSIRDYFAAAALSQALSVERDDRTFQSLAEQAFQMADAMLAEREKGK